MSVKDHSHNSDTKDSKPLLLALYPFVRSLLGRLTFASGAAIVCLILFARFSAEFPERGGKLQHFDRAVLAFCEGHQYTPLHQIAYGISWVSKPSIQIAVAVLALSIFVLRGRLWPQAGTLLIGALGGAGVVSGLKLLFHRPRPELIFAPLGYSFPSGHTFMAVVIYGIIAYWIADANPRYRRSIWGCAITAMILVGLSRIYLGEHFPSDVGAGYSAAIPWVWISLSLSSTFRRKAKE